LESVGLAIKPYLELELLFVCIKVNVNVAKAKAATFDFSKLPQLQRGDVQIGLLVSRQYVVLNINRFS